MKYGKKLNFQKTDPVLKFVFKSITESSSPTTKTPIVSASPSLLEYYRLFSSLNLDEHTELITFENQYLKIIDEFLQNTDVDSNK